MTGDCHVRFWERPGVKLPGATRLESGLYPELSRKAMLPPHWGHGVPVSQPASGVSGLGQQRALRAASRVCLREPLARISNCRMRCRPGGRAWRKRRVGSLAGRRSVVAVLLACLACGLAVPEVDGFPVEGEDLAIADGDPVGASGEGLQQLVELSNVKVCKVLIGE